MGFCRKLCPCCCHRVPKAERDRVKRVHAGDAVDDDVMENLINAATGEAVDPEQTNYDYFFGAAEDSGRDQSTVAPDWEEQIEGAGVLVDTVARDSDADEHFQQYSKSLHGSPNRGKSGVDGAHNRSPPPSSASGGSSSASGWASDSSARSSGVDSSVHSSSKIRIASVFSTTATSAQPGSVKVAAAARGHDEQPVVESGCYSDYYSAQDERPHGEQTTSTENDAGSSDASKKSTYTNPAFYVSAFKRAFAATGGGVEPSNDPKTPPIGLGSPAQMVGYSSSSGYRMKESDSSDEYDDPEASNFNNDEEPATSTEEEEIYLSRYN
ncbi:unnamed protein product [Amoebophrya sp. A120]|nr:unnamed protein product [Amoebophrya sp. A120]|eukprot:GSA120T00004416001.1